MIHNKQTHNNKVKHLVLGELMLEVKLESKYLHQLHQDNKDLQYRNNQLVLVKIYIIFHQQEIVKLLKNDNLHIYINK